MLFERAKEIYFSPHTIEVLHDGSPVWITNLNITNSHIEVKKFNFVSDNMLEVPVNELVEGRVFE